MKVLLINHFPLEGSGSGTYVKNIAEYLIKRGHTVHIIFPDNQTPAELRGAELIPVYFTGETALPGALPFNFPCFTTHPKSAATFAGLSQAELELYMATFERVISAEVSSFKPDIIHSQHVWCLSALAAKQPCPCVVTAHGTDIMGFDKWPQLRGYAEQAISGCDKMIAISRDNLAQAEQAFPQCREKMQLLHNGYNESIFYPEQIDRAALLKSYGIDYSGERIVFFAGKLTGFKGVDVLLKAAASYERAPGERISTLIAGSGEKYGELTALAKSLGLRSVHFLGHMSQPEVRRLYNAAELFTMPSRREPFGLVALEAMACGTPVVASNEGGLPEFVRAEVGALVPSDDPDALCEAILNELRNPHSRQAVAAYAAAHYTQTVFIDKLEKIYAQLLE